MYFDDVAEPMDRNPRARGAVGHDRVSRADRVVFPLSGTGAFECRSGRGRAVSGLRITAWSTARPFPNGSISSRWIGSTSTNEDIKRRAAAGRTGRDPGVGRRTAGGKGPEKPRLGIAARQLVLLLAAASRVPGAQGHAVEFRDRARGGGRHRGRASGGHPGDLQMAERRAGRGAESGGNSAGIVGRGRRGSRMAGDRRRGERLVLSAADGRPVSRRHRLPAWAPRR